MKYDVAFITNFGPDLIVVLVIWGFIAWGIMSLGGSLIRLFTKPAPEQRIQKLRDMLEAGTITEVEYQEQRRRILSEV